MSTEWAQLRQIMYQPSACWLSTEHSGDRWLTDQFVLLDVSGLEAFAELPDGPYKLTVANGPQPRASVPEPDIEAWFALTAQCLWGPVTPSEWSVAEHPGKAMLWAWGARIKSPCLLGESTWTALKRHHPDCLVEYTDELNLFRFSELPHDCPGCQGTEGVYCGHRPVPFCYAAGIRIPDGQEEAACALAVSTSNEETS